MATNDGGTGPTDLSGVTYLGRPNDESKQSYHIKRTSGKVLGPFDADLIVQMIRGEKLSGDEGVSQDQVRGCRSWRCRASLRRSGCARRPTQATPSSA